MPAEVLDWHHGQRAVFRLPMEHSNDTDDPLLRVSFQPEHATLVHEGTSSPQTSLRAWAYDGPTALRGQFDLHS